VTFHQLHGLDSIHTGAFSHPMALAAANESTTLMSVCGELLHWVALIVGLIGVAVIVYGVIRGLQSLIIGEIKGRTEQARTQTRLDLGYYLLLGLEFLVAADVIESLLAPDLQHLAVLGAIVVIRTVISFSLNWELSHHERQNAKT